MTADRRAPTSGVDVSLDGDQYADAVAEEVAELWRYAVTPVTISSGTNALVGAAATPFLVLASGNNIRFTATATNTGAVTLNLDGLGVKSLKSATGASLTAGMIVSGIAYRAMYDGTDWLLDPVVPDLGTLTNAYTEKSAPVPNDFVSISDSEASNVSKKVRLSNLIAAVGGGGSKTLLRRYTDDDFDGSFNKINLTEFDNSTYTAYLLEIEGIRAAVDSVFNMYISTDGGSTYKGNPGGGVGGTFHTASVGVDSSGVNGEDADTSATDKFMSLTTGQIVEAGSDSSGLSCRVWLHNFANTDRIAMAYGINSLWTSGQELFTGTLGAAWDNAGHNAIDAIRISTADNNFATVDGDSNIVKGVVKLWGLND